MTMKKLVLIAMLAATTAATPAFAVNNYHGVYESTTDPDSAIFDFTTSSTPNSVGGYNVLSISGTAGGDTITGLVLNPNQPNTSTSADGLYFYDNNFWPASDPSLSNPGLLFTAGVNEYNLFSDGAGVYQLYRAIPNGSGGNQWQNVSTGTFTVNSVSSPAPEPASWAMMLGGFGAIGGALRRRQAANLRFA